jgi:transketolase
VGMGWHKYAGDKGRIVSHERFGVSAPYKVLLEKFGFTAQRVAYEAEKVIKDSA